MATWNLGYAGMGEESDFILDLGQQSRPLSAELVRKNAAGIAQQLPRLEADVVLLQEVARPSFSTYGFDLLAAVRSALPNHGVAFGADVDTRFVPQPFSIQIGNASLSRVAVAAAERRALPLEPEFQYGLFRKGYRMHILRLAGEVPWVFVNIHLSAFDDSSDAVRERQLQSVMDFAVAEYEAGRHVVVGGDWNMRLAPTDFAHTTAEKYLFWVRDLPANAVPAGWSWGVDRRAPTVRTANQPYVRGENYRLIIDGFLVSPNVALEKVTTIDLDFETTDHNPVIAHVRAR